MLPEYSATRKRLRWVVRPLSHNLHGRHIHGCERCLVELSDDRLRRATRQEYSAPGWRLKIRKFLLMGTGQIWQGRVYSRPQGRDFAALSFFEGETDGSEGNTDGFEAN
jgi:hypothetical protein